jgi:hypothetical protein
MNTSENKIADEIHGCIVCAKLFTVLTVYTPDGKLLDCTVTSPGGHIVSDERHPLAACDTHTEEEVKFAYKRWLSKTGKILNDKQEDG